MEYDFWATALVFFQKMYMWIILLMYTDWLFENFVCNKACFKLYPVFNWKSMMFFNWG